MSRFSAPIAEQIWDMKYRLKTADDEPIDSCVEESWWRVAKDLARVEAEPGIWEEKFYAALEDFKFLPAGRIAAGAGTQRKVTRMWPKREADLLNGGSIYGVIKGQLQCRQKILRLDEIYREDGIRRCAIVLDPEIIRTHLAPKRPFQGWRYLKPEQAPADLPSNRQDEEDLPVELAGALADIGVF